MSDLNDWADSAADNDRSQLPDYMKEGATPVPAVNDWGREVQAAVRRFFETLEWRNFLDESETPVLDSSSSFTVPSGKVGLYAEEQRTFITLSAPNSNGNSTFYATIDTISVNTITIVPDDPLDEVTADITKVEVGLDPTNSPISSEAIYNFASEVIAVAGETDASMRRVDIDPAVTGTQATTTTFTVEASDRFELWEEARISIVDGGDTWTASITSIVFGADPELDPATVTIVEDDSNILTGPSLTVDVITPSQDDAVVFDSRGQVRGAGVPLATVSVEVVDVSSAVPSSSGDENSFAHGQDDWDIVNVYLIPKAAAISAGFTADSQVPIATENATNSEGTTLEITPDDVKMANKGGVKFFSVNGTTVDFTSTNWSAEAVFIKFTQIAIP